MNTLIDQLNKIIQEANWPAEHHATIQNRRIYENGLDIVNMYRGHPAILGKALRKFQGTRSSPYAYAGIAYTLATASRGRDGQAPDQRGLKGAMHWLEKSQNLEPDRLEINFIEAVIYLNARQHKNARLILDYLNDQDPGNYYLCVTEMNYWDEQSSDKQYLHWVQQAVNAANSNIRRIWVMNALAGFYLGKGMYERSLKTYQQVAKLDPNDPWLWHNMSVMYVEMKHFKEAENCNKRALSIMDFGAARDIEQVIKKNRGGLSRF
jgi:tetratricopeptide (TPR) repeat protein